MSPELLPAVAFGVDGIDALRDVSRHGLSSRVSARNVSYRDVIDIIAKSGIRLTPMIGRERLIQGSAFALKAARDRSLLDDPRMALFPTVVTDSYRAEADMLRSRPNDMTSVDAALKGLKTTVAAIVAAGGTIAAGSGAPFVPYGLGLHTELEWLVEAGLTPYQALHTATVNAAEALGVSDEIGSVEAGKLADLVFVGGDPARDIKNARDVRGVMRGGRYYDLPTLLKH